MLGPLTSYLRSAPSAARLEAGASYSLSALMVAAAAVGAFVVERLAGPTNLALIFVAPVVLSAVAFGWGQALAAGVGGVLAFDFFFVEPRFTLRVAGGSDLWVLSLLLAVAALVSTVAGQGRRRALEAAQARSQVGTLAAFAAAVRIAPSEEAALQAAAEALHRLFSAPAVVFRRRELALTVAASAGGGEASPAETAAARWALGSGLPLRAGAYPCDGSVLDVWPAGGGVVLGVDFSRAARPRPDEADAIAGLLRAALAAARPSLATTAGG